MASRDLLPAYPQPYGVKHLWSPSNHIQASLFQFTMSDDVWPLHNKISVLASSLLYPDVVGHGIVFNEASPNLLSVYVDIEACRVDKHGE